MAAYEAMVKTQNIHTAVVIPQKVLQHCNVKVIAQNIQDDKRNQTTFIAIQKPKVKMGV